MLKRSVFNDTRTELIIIWVITWISQTKITKKKYLIYYKILYRNAWFHLWREEYFCISLHLRSIMNGSQCAPELGTFDELGAL